MSAKQSLVLKHFFYLRPTIKQIAEQKTSGLSQGAAAIIKTHWLGFSKSYLCKQAHKCV
jgi:hypothetical protein